MGEIRRKAFDFGQRAALFMLSSAKAKQLPVEINSPELGFFAHMNVAMRIMLAAEERGMLPCIRMVSANYADMPGENWFPHLFDAADPLAYPAIGFRIRTHRDLGLTKWDNLPLRKANAVLFRHYRLKPSLAAQIDAFCAERGIGDRTLGIHYRGTDKSAEAPRVTYEAMFDAVEERLATRAFDNVFVATDEQEFLRQFRERFGAVPVHYFDITRSSNGVAMHLTGKFSAGNTDKARSALLDSLMLSRCGALVRTASLLSSWASVFNPDLKVTVLNQAYGHASWWPECVISAEAVNLAPTVREQAPA